MWQSVKTSLLAVLILSAFLYLAQQSIARGDDDPGQLVGEFLLLLLGTQQGKREALEFVDTNGQPDFTPMLLEVPPIGNISPRMS